MRRKSRSRQGCASLRKSLPLFPLEKLVLLGIPILLCLNLASLLRWNWLLWIALASLALSGLLILGWVMACVRILIACLRRYFQKKMRLRILIAYLRRYFQKKVRRGDKSFAAKRSDEMS